LTLGGSGFFAFGMMFAMIFVPATDVLGSWRLSQRHREAPGLIQAEETTNFSEGGGEGREGEQGTPIYRYVYTFRLPDGSEYQGHSFHLGQLSRPAGQPFRPMPVVVEYDPEHPQTNRIQGMRTSAYEGWALFVLIFLLAGLAAALIGLAVGQGRARVLRDGEFMTATIETVHFGSGDDATEMPVAEYKQQFRRVPGLRTLPWVAALAGGYLHLWTVMAAVIGLFGVVVCVGLLVMVVIMPMPPRERGLFGLGVGGFFIVWVTMALLFFQSGRRGLRAMDRRRSPERTAPVVKCGFTFALPDGQSVQAKGPGRVRVDADPEPAQPALYDPRRPRRALLLSGLEPDVGLGHEGSWETTAGAGAVGRLLVVGLLLIGPPLVRLFLL
jgi:hypothetical protein